MVAMHNDLEKENFEIKFAFIKKGWDFHSINHWANELFKKQN
jgi:hypothetical protein